MKISINKLDDEASKKKALSIQELSGLLRAQSKGFLEEVITALYSYPEIQSKIDRYLHGR